MMEMTGDVIAEVRRRVGLRVPSTGQGVECFVAGNGARFDGDAAGLSRTIPALAVAIRGSNKRGGLSVRFALEGYPLSAPGR